MRLKDYYRTLGVPSSATAEEIRKSFRRLALQYHPDRHPDSPFAAGHFIEIKEAYNILGNAQNRYKYDEERWLTGMAGRTGRITPEWVIGEGDRLRKHMADIDTYRMSHPALQQYVLLLLSDEHLAVITSPEQKQVLISHILVSTRHLDHKWLPPVTERLLLLANGAAELMAPVTHELRKRAELKKKEVLFRQSVFALILGLILAVLIVLRMKIK